MANDEIRFGPFRLDLRRRALLREDKAIRLGGRALDILCELALAAGNIVTKDELMARLWSGQIVEEGNIHVHVSALRKALDDEGGGHSYVVTVPGRGYRLAVRDRLPPAGLNEALSARNQPLSDDFRAKLLHVLSVSNLSRTSLAKLVGVDKSVASRWVSGATRPTDANLDALTSGLARSLPALRLAHWKLPLADFRRIVHSIGDADAERQVDQNPVSWLADRLSSNRPVIAVMPFGDLARTAENEAFCDSLTDELITALARLSGLQVVGSGSTFTFKGQAVGAEEAAHAVAARYIVEGKVQRAGDRVRVTVQLIDTGERVTLWADRFDTELDDIFRAQDEIIRNICSRIDTRIILNQAVTLTRSNAIDWRVADRARAAMAMNYGNDPASYATARKLLEPILSEQPDNALALRTMAVTDWHEALFGFAADPSKNYLRALQKAQRSIELDPTDEYAYWICGLTLLTARRFDEAIAHMQQALEISPNCSLAIGSMGTILAWSGCSEESIAYTNLALSVDPHNPSIFFRHNSLGLAHYLNGDLDDARLYLGKALSRRPNWPVPNLMLAAVEFRTGNIAEARRIVRRTCEFDPGCLTLDRFRVGFPFRNEGHFDLLRAELNPLQA